ncbi:hypothetical protein ACP4OV_031784 [Aristida adscensionis]
MAGQGYGYHDYFSPSSSSSSVPRIFSAAVPSNSDADDNGHFPDQPANPSFCTPRAHNHSLDLNSQVEDFPFIEPYSGLVRSEGGRGEVLGRGARAGHSEFQPPRPAGGCGAAGRGGHPGGRRSKSAGTTSGPQIGVQGMGVEGGGRVPLMGGHGCGAHRVTTSIPRVVGGRDGIEEDDNISQSKTYDKASWTNENNTYIFCELAVDQIRAGERPNGQMTPRGWKEVQKKFREKAGLYHEIRQFKNRWTQCRILWSFHDMTLKNTGLGRNPNGTLIADDDWWNKHTKKKPECKKFRKFIPAYINFLKEMYQGWTVDGHSSCIPGMNGDGDENAADNEEGEEADEDAHDYNSPLSISSRKRGHCTTTSTVTSPSKRQKNPASDSALKKPKNAMVKAMKGLIDTIQAGNTQEQNNVRMASEQKRMEEQQSDQEIRSCLRMAKESGASEETDEYCAATQLFEKKYNRTESVEEDLQMLEYMKRCRKRRKDAAVMGAVIGMLYYDTYFNKADYRVPKESGYDWVMRNLENPTECYNMFRMNRDVFDKLHHLLVESYGLKSSKKMTSLEALGLFLWMCGAPQRMRQAQNRFTRSSETCSRKFDKVLRSVNRLGADIIRPRDPEFRTVHKRLKAPRFSPFFDNCIGAIDGTHIGVVVPTNQVVQHTGRHGYTTQNVLAICDFDMMFTFIVAGWPGSVHDMRVFSDAQKSIPTSFPTHLK